MTCLSPPRDCQGTHPGWQSWSSGSRLTPHPKAPIHGLNILGLAASLRKQQQGSRSSPLIRDMETEAQERAGLRRVAQPEEPYQPEVGCPVLWEEEPKVISRLHGGGPKEHSQLSPRAQANIVRHPLHVSHVSHVPVPGFPARRNTNTQVLLLFCFLRASPALAPSQTETGRERGNNQLR